MPSLSREEIFERGRPKSEEFEIAGLGKVSVRQWEFKEQMAFREKLRSEDYAERQTAIPWVVARCILDRPNGVRIFTTDEDIAILATLQGDILSELFDKIMRFSGSDAEEVKKQGESSAETSTPA